MIKKAAPKDLESIMSLIRVNSDTFSELEIPVAQKHIKELINKQNKDNKFFIKVISGKVVGCAGYSKQEDACGIYFLNWLAVHPEFKRQGIATGLYGYIESKIKTLNARMIILNAESGEINRFFYNKVGFKVAGIIPKYYRENKDLIWYYKNL